MADNRGPRRFAVWIAALGVCLSGCSATAPTTSPTAASPPGAASTAAAPSTTGAAASGVPVTAEELRRVLAVAGGTADPSDSDLGRLWAKAFGELEIDGQRPYAAPARVVPYRAGALPDTACASPGAEARFRNDARYCPADQSISYDEDWLLSMSGRLSYAGPLAVLAHEWGHHVQSIIGVPELDIAKELQADCLSGLYATASGLYEHTGDRESELRAMEAGLRTWSELADAEYADSAWFDPGIHGSMQQRMMAFTTGAQANVELGDAEPSIAAGVSWCDGYRAFVARDYATIGPYRFLNIPGRRATRSGEIFTVAPETRTNRTSSGIVLLWIPQLPLAGGATAEQLRALWQVGYPDIVPLGEVPIAGSISSGTGTASYYENRSTIDGVETVESGIFALLAPEAAVGGLIVVVARPSAAPTESAAAEMMDVLEEQLGTLYQVLTRLCSPDAGGDTTAAHPDVACMTELQ